MSQEELRCGYTTGTCGAAAAFAAAALLFEEEELTRVLVTTPKGVELTIPIAESVLENGWARCGVIKDSGDDPDVTNGALVQVTITWERDGGEEEGLHKPLQEPEKWYRYPDSGQEPSEGDALLFLRGGQGIGQVTREGLECPPGMWAINPVPRQMIFQQVQRVCRRCHITGRVYLTIEIPGGEELAQKTMNPHLGILGGLSVLGTSGIVEPMSEAALLETIRLEICQRRAEGSTNLLVVPGNYGEQFVSGYLGLGLDQGIKCSNFIGNTIDYALEAEVEGLLFIGHAGKLLKLAAGVMNTHSSVADGRMECLAAYGAACGAPTEMVCRILSCVTVEEAFGILEEAEGLLEAVMEVAMDRIHSHLKRRAKNQMMIEAILFTNDRGIVGTTPGAVAMMGKMN